MSEPVNYQPKPGDKVLLTVRAQVRADGVYVVRDDRERAVWTAASSSSYVVRVEPAPVELPTGWGARITATVNGKPNTRLTLVDPGDSQPWRVHPGDTYGVGGTWFSSSDLSDVVVLDPGEVES